jgi:membrane-bound ClpP family serine protease
MTAQPVQPAVRPPSARSRNGLGVAALVLGVASLVAAFSFVLFPLGLLGGLVAVILGVIALSRRRTSGATNPRQAWAGTICGILALVAGIVFSVRVGTFVEHNTSAFTSFDNCIAKAGNRNAVANCIARLANSIR